MTRLAILSDIHGNLPALEAAFNDLAQFQIDLIVVAGDSVNFGPFTNPIMERLTQAGCAVIRGNAELYLTETGTPRVPALWTGYTIPSWTVRHLDNRWQNVIAAWPDALTLRFRDAPTVRVVHGSPRSHFEAMYPISSDAEIAEMLAGVEESTVICGHTHIAMDRQVSGWHVVNPGTVGVPLDGVPGAASYILLDGNAQGWQATPRRVHYDMTPLFQEFERTEFVKCCGVVGALAVEEYRTARLLVAPFNAWHTAQYPSEPASMVLLEEFYKADRWAYTLPAYHININHSNA